MALTSANSLRPYHHRHQHDSRNTSSGRHVFDGTFHIHACMFRPKDSYHSMRDSTMMLALDRALRAGEWGARYIVYNINFVVIINNACVCVVLVKKNNNNNNFAKEKRTEQELKKKAIKTYYKIIKQDSCKQSKSSKPIVYYVKFENACKSTKSTTNPNSSPEFQYNALN